MKSQVVVTPINGSLQTAIEQCFLPFNGNGRFFKGKIMIKVNLCTSYPSAITNPDVVVALIKYLIDYGVQAKNIIVFDNAASPTPTRLVALIEDFGKKVRQTGAKMLYLDECRSCQVNFDGKILHKSIPFPKILSEQLIDHRNENTYINVPKLKTHCQAGITCCLKNQHGLLYDNEKLFEHHHIDEKIIDIWKKVHPDFNIVDATTIINNGSVPYRPDWVIPMNLLLAGTDGVAIDTVGANLLGISEVKMLKLAARDKLGETNLDQIEILPDRSILEKNRLICNADPQKMPIKVPDNIQIFPGKDWAGCPGGCRAIYLFLPLIVDEGNKYPLICLLGRGHDLHSLDQQIGPFLVIGPCAINELRPYFIHRKDSDKIKVSYCENHFNLFGLVSSVALLLRLPLSVFNRLFQMPMKNVMGTYISAFFHGAKKFSLG